MLTKTLNTEFVCDVLKESKLLDDQAVNQIKLTEKEYRHRLQQASKTNGSTPITAVDIITAMKLPSAADAHQILSEEMIMKTLAEHWQIPFLKIDFEKLGPCVASSKISKPFALKHLAIPVSISKKILFVAVVDPMNIDIVDTIKRTSGMKIRLVVSTKTDILKAIEQCYGGRKPEEKQGLTAFQSSVSAAHDELATDERIEKSVTAVSEPDEKHIINAVSLLLNYALQQRTGEIHLEPKREHSLIRFRIDGILFDVKRIPLEVHAGIVRRFKALGGMNISEKRKPQDGRTYFDFHARPIDLRISIIPTALGEKTMIRITDPILLIRHIDDLGFFPEERQQYQEALSRPSGIVIFAGPTGSGKTTTLYSTLNHLSERGINIITIEDPIESVYEEFNQMTVQPAIGVTFGSAIRHIVRQSPDVIMVGEMRDEESVGQTIQAALTGHLVITTLHTEDAASALVRMVNIGAEPFLVESSVIAVIAQRLVRKVCENCAYPYQSTSRDICALHLPQEQMKMMTLRKGSGCEKCRGTGYFGQTAVFEVLEITDNIRTLIHNQAGAYSLRNAAMTQGMHSLKQRAIEKMAAGVTTCEEVLRITGGLQDIVPHKFQSKIFWGKR